MFTFKKAGQSSIVASGNVLYLYMVVCDIDEKMSCRNEIQII